MAIYDWSNAVSKWHFNPDNCRNPTCVYNNTGLPIGGPINGYTGTQYDFSPINFAPNSTVPPSTYTRIKLDQFGVGIDPDTNAPVVAKQVILTIDCETIGPNQWNNTIYTWFRRPGSSWNLSPIEDSGHQDCCTIFAPVGYVDGVPAIEMAWGLASPLGSGDSAWLTAILTGWGH